MVQQMSRRLVFGGGVLTDPAVGGQQQAEDQGQQRGEIVGGEQGRQGHQQHGRRSDPVYPYPQMMGGFLLSHRRLCILILRHETLSNLVGSAPTVEWECRFEPTNGCCSLSRLISLGAQPGIMAKTEQSYRNWNGR